MSKFRITCIDKVDRPNPYERIQKVGLDNGQIVSQTDIVNAIDKNQHTFYVTINGNMVDVTTSTSRFGHRYIKTIADDDEPNNLLSLMECVS